MSDFGTVLGVQTDGSVNVAATGANYEGVTNCVFGYTPKQGDRVLVDKVKLQVVIVGTIGVNAPPTAPTVSVQDSPPSGSQYRQVTSLYQDTSAGDTVATLIGVRSSPPPTPTTTSGSFVPSDAGTWDSVNGWASGDVMQGQVDGFPYPRTGLWLYPSMTTAQTVTGLSITVHRRDAGGLDGNVPLRFYLHNYTAAPGGSPALAEFYDGTGTLLLSRDVTGTFTLPTAWGAALAAGTRTGVGIYSTAYGDYGRFDGPAASGVLNFTYAV